MKTNHNQYNFQFRCYQIDLSMHFMHTNGLGHHIPAGGQTPHKVYEIIDNNVSGINVMECYCERFYCCRYEIDQCMPHHYTNLNIRIIIDPIFNYVTIRKDVIAGTNM